MKGTIGLVALSLSGVQAVRRSEKSWRPAQATMDAVPLLDGTSPRPTAAPGQPFDDMLRKRGAKDNTCGYVDGLTESALGCATTAECVLNSIYSVVGCCPDSSTACPIPTTCFDYTESVSFTSTNKNDLYCSETAYPSCIQHLYEGDAFNGYTLWDCARNSGRTDTVYYLPLTTGSTTTDSSTSTSPTSSSTVSQVATLTSQPASATTPVVTGSSNPDPDDNKKSTPIGAIVGGVVGGVAAIALLATALFFILRKKKQPTPPPAAATAAPGQPPAPGQPGYYDPNQPQMAQQQGQYGYPQGAPGFVPVDPRASIAKPPYAPQQNYDPNQPQQFSPPGSPAPAYGYNGVGTPPPAGFTPSPQPTGEYQQQPYQAQQYNPNGQPGQVSPPPAHATSFAAELPAHRGDGELRELA